MDMLKQPSGQVAVIGVYPILVAAPSKVQAQVPRQEEAVRGRQRSRLDAPPLLGVLRSGPGGTWRLAGNAPGSQGTGPRNLALARLSPWVCADAKNALEIALVPDVFDQAFGLIVRSVTEPGVSTSGMQHRDRQALFTPSERARLSRCFRASPNRTFAD
jgi:hypothetical protein